MSDPTAAERLLDATLAAQRAKGRRTYGQGLDAHDGHDWPMEALQEAVDGMQYLAAEIARLRALVLELREVADPGAAGHRDPARSVVPCLCVVCRSR